MNIEIAKKPTYKTLTLKSKNMDPNYTEKFIRECTFA